jgi:hypothetical protein
VYPKKEREWDVIAVVDSGGRISYEGKGKKKREGGCKTTNGQSRGKVRNR